MLVRPISDTAMLGIELGNELLFYISISRVYRYCISTYTYTLYLLVDSYTLFYHAGVYPISIKVFSTLIG